MSCVWEQLLLQPVLPGPGWLLGGLGAGTVPWGWDTSLGPGTVPWVWDSPSGLGHLPGGWDSPSGPDLFCSDKEGQIKVAWGKPQRAGSPVSFRAD